MNNHSRLISGIIRHLMPILGIIGAIAAIIVIYTFLAGQTGSIVVTSSPAGASIYLDNNYKGQTQFTITKVPRGTHTIRLCLQGYEVWSSSVPVTDGETSHVDARLAPTTGSIVVASSPSGASLYLDNYYQGQTQLTITEVPPVPIHTINLRLEGYEVWSTSVQVTAGETSYVEATLTPIPTEPSTGAITVASEPAGASIYLDGEYMGSTPQTITGVSQGAHNIELRLEGYEGLSDRVQVIAGETSYVAVPLYLIPTEPSTEPSFASAFTNITMIGFTNFTKDMAIDERFASELTNVTMGVTNITKGMDIDERSDVDATMTPIPTEPSTGTITVASSPAGASIYLNDEYMGSTPQTITAVSSGTHTIELRLEDYVVWPTSVEVTAGETSYVDATMTPIPTEPSTPPIPTPTSITLTYHDFDLNDVCTPEDNYCGWANAPGKAVVYGSMATDINVPEGASELEVTISISCNGYGEGLSGQPNSSANIRVDSEERAERIDSTMPSHHGNYYKYEWCNTFSNTFNVRGEEEITLIIEMSGGARLDFDQAELTFS
jgi:hypothetical protein